MLSRSTCITWNHTLAETKSRYKCRSLPVYDPNIWDVSLHHNQARLYHLPLLGICKQPQCQSWINLVDGLAKMTWSSNSFNNSSNLNMVAILLTYILYMYMYKQAIKQEVQNSNYCIYTSISLIFILIFLWSFAISMCMCVW